MTPFGITAPGRILFGRGEAAKAPALIRALGERGSLVHGANPARAAWLLEALGPDTLALPCVGEPTLAEQSRAAETDRRSAAQSHPIVQAILLAFPGAQIDAVRDETVDEYGLKPIIRDEEPDFPEFAPPEAESAGFDLPEED